MRIKLFLSTTLITGCLIGCTPTTVHSPAIQNISEGAVKISTRSDFIRDLLQEINGFDSIKTLITSQTINIVAAAHEIQLKADIATAEFRTEQNWRIWLERENKNLNENFFSPRQRRLASLFIALFTIFNILVIILPLIFGGSGLMISKFIVKILPIMNIASFIRDKLITRNN